MCVNIIPKQNFLSPKSQIAFRGGGGGGGGVVSEHQSTIPQEDFLSLKIQILFRGGGGGVSEHHSKTKFSNSKCQIEFRGGGGGVSEHDSTSILMYEGWCLNINQPFHKKI